MKLAGRKSTLNPPVVYSTVRSKVMVAVLILLVYSTRRFVFSCLVLFCSFQSF